MTEVYGALIFGMVFIMFVCMLYIAFSTHNKTNTKRIISGRTTPFYELVENVRYLKNIHENDIYKLLFEVLNTELDSLTINTQAERSLWLYFKKKMDEVAKAYYFLRDSGFENIENDGLINSLIGSGRSEMFSIYQYQLGDKIKSYPNTLLNQVDHINKVSVRKFRDNIRLQAIHSDDIIGLLKINIIAAFRSNVKQLYNLYKKTCHEIQDPEYIARYNLQGGSPDTSPEIKTQKKKIFISYNHANKEVAHQISNHLQKHGYQTVTDWQDMKGGDDIFSFIRKSVAIADITLSLVSKESLLSGWVGTETVNSFYISNLTDKKFVACLLDDCIFHPEIVVDSILATNKKIGEVNKQIEKHDELKTSAESLTDQKERLIKLRDNFDSIIARLRNSLCIDLAKMGYLDQLVEMID